MKEEGKGSKAPLTESFLHYPNNKYVLLALLGATAGQGVVWYTGQFYALFFLTITLKLNCVIAYLMIGISLVDRHAVLHLVRLAVGQDRAAEDHHGGLPDRGGHLLPAVRGPDALRQSGPGSASRQRTRSRSPPIRATCNFQSSWRPWSNFTQCDRAQGLPHQVGTLVQDRDVAGAEVHGRHDRSDRRRSTAGTTRSGIAALKTAGYPASADPAKVNWSMATLILLIMVIYVTMVYGPIAAFLVEMFPTKIRYTSMSLPYHIGNGWFGGMLPLLATAIVAATGDIYAGLWYPIGVAVMTLIIGVVFLRDTLGVDLRTGRGVAIQKVRNKILLGGPIGRPAVSLAERPAHHRCRGAFLSELMVRRGTTTRTCAMPSAIGVDGAKADVPHQIVDVGIGRRHVARLHRQHFTLRGSAQRLLQQIDHMRHIDRLIVADVVDAPGRRAAARVGPVARP